MAIETMTFLTESGMTTIAVPVPEEFESGELRRAWSEGTGAGATVMWDALQPGSASPRRLASSVRRRAQPRSEQP